MTRAFASPSVPRPDERNTRKLTQIWQDLLGVEPIEPDQNYFDLGGDSSLAVQMFSRIETEFHVKLPLVTLYEAPTIEEMERLLKADVPSSGWSPLVPIQPNGSRPPLFFFHGAGGTVLTYRKLSTCLGADQPFYGLQCQGLDGQLPLLTTVEEMAALYVRHIRSVQPHGPYFLGGYCMGGTLAYEAAQQLYAAGEPVALLALLDTMNWHKVPLNFWSRSSHSIQQVLFHAASFLKLNVADQANFFRDKSEVLRDRIPVWLGFLKAGFKNTTKGEKSDSLLLGQIWKNNDRACWNYIPQKYPGTITDFRPCKQYRVFSKPDLKWEDFAKSDVVVLPVYPAGMLVEPFVKSLSAALRASMDRAISSTRRL